MHRNGKSIWLSFPLIAALGIAGCGGDGGNDAGNGTPIAPVTIHGVAMAGAIQGKVCAFPVNAAGVIGETALACTSSEQGNGAFYLTIADYIGDVILASSGSYVDEHTAETIYLDEKKALRSATGWNAGGVTKSVAITPLTEAAVRAAIAAGGATHANIVNAMRDIALALHMDTANADAAYDSIAGTLPRLTTDNNSQLGYAAFLDLLSTAQFQYCGNEDGCDVFRYLDHVLGLIRSQSGTEQFRRSLQEAYAIWRPAQVYAPFACDYSSGDFICVPQTPASRTDTGVTGHHNVNVRFNTPGASPFDISNVSKPNTLDEFCAVAIPLLVSQNQVVSTLHACSFDGDHGTVTVGLWFTSKGFFGYLHYTVEYTYTEL
jgi:hypothetical protein